MDFRICQTFSEMEKKDTENEESVIDSWFVEQFHPDGRKTHYFAVDKDSIAIDILCTMVQRGFFSQGDVNDIMASMDVTEGWRLNTISLHASVVYELKKTLQCYFNSDGTRKEPSE